LLQPHPRLGWMNLIDCLAHIDSCRWAAVITPLIGAFLDMFDGCRCVPLALALCPSMSRHRIRRLLNTMTQLLTRCALTHAQRHTGLVCSLSDSIRSDGRMFLHVLSQTLRVLLGNLRVHLSLLVLKARRHLQVECDGWLE